MSDNDLIRRGDAFAVVKGLRLLEGDITALPAVTADALSVPEVGSVIRALESVIAEMHHLRAALRGLEDRG